MVWSGRHGRLKMETVARAGRLAGVLIAIGLGAGLAAQRAPGGAPATQASCEAALATSTGERLPAGCKWLQTWSIPAVNITPNVTQAYFPSVAAQTFGAAPGNIVIPGVALSSALEPPTDTTNTAARFSNTTIRQVARVSAGGSQIRLRLSNIATPDELTIDDLHVARWNKSACPAPLVPVAPATTSRGPACSNIVAGTDVAVTVGGQRTIKIVAGGEVYTDPVALSVPPLGEVAVSMYFKNLTPPVTSHVFGATSAYRVVGLPGSNANFTSAEVFDAATIGGKAALAVGGNRVVIAGLDVVAPASTRGIVAAGDSITDGANSTPETNSRWSDVLAERIVLAHRTPSVPAPAVSHAGIGGNRVITNAAAQFGTNLVERFDRDVLSRSGITDVIVLEGINDIGQSPTFTETAENLIAAFRGLVQRAHAAGIKIYFGTIPPIRTDAATAAGTYTGAFSQSQALFETREPRRQAVNQWILSSREHDGVVDFNAALSAPGLLNQLYAPFSLNLMTGGNDQLHPNSNGYRAMAEAIDLSWFLGR